MHLFIRDRFFFRSEYLSNMVNLVWNEDETTNGNSSLLKSLSVVIEMEENDDDTMNEECDDVEKEIPVDESKVERKTGENDKKKNAEDDAESKENASEKDEINDANTDDNPIENEPNEEMASENSDEKNNKIEETKSSERTTPIALVKTKNQVKVKIPPIWTPSEKRANAALIYLYFRPVSRCFVTNISRRLN